MIDQLQLDELYNRCINRIDDDIEIAEEYLIGCVTYLRRQYTGRADRDRVREDFSLIRGLNKYERELHAIVHLSDDSLCTLIASSLDLSKDLRHICDLFDKIKIASMDKDDAKKQSAQAKRASDMFAKIAKILEPKKEIQIGNLFSDGE